MFLAMSKARADLVSLILRVWNARSARKHAPYRTDNNTSVSLDSAQPPSTQTPVPSTDSRSPLSTDNRNPPSTDILHPTSIDIPSRTSIDTKPQDMVAPLILVRDNNGDLDDQEGHLRNAAGSALPIDRQQHFRVARFCSTTVDPDTSPVDQFSLTPVDRQHKPSVDRHPSSDIDQHSISDIDRY
ncbi:hypothetical protein F2Q69_00048296 [Brassica cretica]|uniref:Uncharacterized protein n=1 Tax=Brassica cretica TaxID=69181 RepID=A0A8S9PTH9_BRACR|nr:hypothetical protein F2Q69_00048296 [Brassica cretica]